MIKKIYSNVISGGQNKSNISNYMKQASVMNPN